MFLIVPSEKLDLSIRYEVKNFIPAVGLESVFDRQLYYDKSHFKLSLGRIDVVGINYQLEFLAVITGSRRDEQRDRRNRIVPTPRLHGPRHFRCRP
jgi:hypothetical protein